MMNFDLTNLTWSAITLAAGLLLWVAIWRISSSYTTGKSKKETMGEAKHFILVIAILVVLPSAFPVLKHTSETLLPAVISVFDSVVGGVASQVKGS
jgi:phage-related protein